MVDAKWEVLVLNLERNLDFVGEIDHILYGEENKRYLFDDKNSALAKKRSWKAKELDVSLINFLNANTNYMSVFNY